MSKKNEKKQPKLKTPAKGTPAVAGTEKKPAGPTTDELVALAEAAGLVVKKQSGWTRCSGPADGKKRVYVQNAGRSVRRVHVAGFAPIGMSAATEAVAEGMGSVRAVIRVGEDGWLEDVRRAIAQAADPFHEARAAAEKEGQ